MDGREQGTEAKRERRSATLRRSLNEIIGYRIHASDAELGELGDLLFDDQAWRVRYGVVHIEEDDGERSVLIAAAEFRSPVWEEQRVQVELNREQVLHAPPVGADQPLSRQDEERLHAHYGWTPYWLRGDTPATHPEPIAREIAEAHSTDPERDSALDPHLRSVQEVVGYRMEALDGDIGHVEDLIVEDETWQIRYLVGDTRNWLPGRKVLLPLARVEAIRLDDEHVALDLAREEVRSSPEWDPAQPINHEYENALYDYYGRPVSGEDGEREEPPPPRSE